MSHFIPNSTTYTCHCYFLPLAMTSISDVPCDKHKLNLIHLSQTNPTIYQKKQNFSKNSVMYWTLFCKKNPEHQIWTSVVKYCISKCMTSILAKLIGQTSLHHGQRDDLWFVVIIVWSWRTIEVNHTTAVINTSSSR